MKLPESTTDVRRARADLDAVGVAILDGVVSPNEIRRLGAELNAIADGERTSGEAILEDGSAADGVYRLGPNQRILGLPHKHTCFAELVINPQLLDIAGDTFARSYGYPDEVVEHFGFGRAILSSMTANIANPGGRKMALHADQGFVPPSTPFPVLLNVVVPLVDLTEHNGATHVAPGSHLADPSLLALDPPPTVQVAAPAGSAVLLDGRTWHGTGANRSDTARPVLLLTYCPPWVRPFANHGIDVDASLLRTATPELLDVLGFSRWLVFGVSEARRRSQAIAGRG